MRTIIILAISLSLNSCSSIDRRPTSFNNILKSCFDLLRPKVSNPIFDEKDIDIPNRPAQLISSNDQDTKVINFVEHKMGEFDYIYTLKRKGDQWEDTTGVDAPGSPDYLIKIFGKKVSSELGIENLDKYTFRFPSAGEFLHRYNGLQRRNELLKKFDFYVATNGVTLDTYLKRFAFKASLPLATKNETLLHDINFHIAAPFLVPDFFLDALYHKAKIVLEFEEYLLKNDISFSKEEYNQKKRRIVNHIDFSLGHLSYPAQLGKEEINITFRYFLRDNGKYFLMSDFNFIKERLADYNLESKIITNFLEAKKKSGGKIQEENRPLDYEQFELAYSKNLKALKQLK